MVYLSKDSNTWNSGKRVGNEGVGFTTFSTDKDAN